MSDKKPTEPPTCDLYCDGCRCETPHAPPLSTVWRCTKCFRRVVNNIVGGLTPKDDVSDWPLWIVIGALCMGAGTCVGSAIGTVQTEDRCIEHCECPMTGPREHLPGSDHD